MNVINTPKHNLIRVFTNKKKCIKIFQVVVITGASSGIGEALAHAFYEQGSKVVLAARREAELNRVKNDLISQNLVSIRSVKSL